jgi:hypothetical protein
MPDQYTLEGFYHETAQACLTDLTPPTFAGIAGLSAQPNGSLIASWAAASDASQPIVYDVFIQANTAVNLFAASNRVLSTFSLSQAIFTLPSGTLLQDGVTYHVGVRARDAIGNVDANTASQSAVSQGVPSTSILAAIAAVAGDVWEELLSAHNNPGTFGYNAQNPVLTPAQVASSVLNATLNSYTGAGTVGLAIATAAYGAMDANSIDTEVSTDIPSIASVSTDVELTAEVEVEPTPGTC